MAVFLVPFIPIIVGAAGAIGGGVAINEHKKNKVAERLDALQSLNAKENDLDKKYKAHAAKGEYAQAIKTFRELTNLYLDKFNTTPEQKKLLGEWMQDLVSASQNRAKALSRELKKKSQDLQYGDPSKLYVARRDYIEKLKVVLPADDVFLQKEVKRFDGYYPKLVNN